MNYRTRSATLMSLMTTLALVGCSDGPADPTDAVASLNISRRSPGIYVGSIPRRDSLKTGEQLQLLAAGLDRRGRLIFPGAMSWSTNDSARAVVSGRGMVTAMGKGGPVIISAASAGFVGTATLVIVGTSSAGPAPTDSAPVVTPPVVTPPVVTPPVVVPPVVTPPVVTPPVTTPPVVVTPPTGNGPWSYCTATGAVCDFVGLRDVRIANPSGTKSYVQEAFGTVPCAPYGFNNQNPAPAEALHCDYGPMKMTSITNPNFGLSAGLPRTLTIARGSDGVSGPQRRNTGFAGFYTDGSGSFRTVCRMSKSLFDDPIVFPGRPGAAHLHVFFGNTDVDANSTVASIANSGNSTCRGGTLNRSAYWFPAMYDSQTGEVQTPDDGIFYYKTGYAMDPASIKPLPAGLRMIAGDVNNRSTQDFKVIWSCRDANWTDVGSVPNCPVGDAVKYAVFFPQCWDGVNLDSPDHKSHMSYPIYSNSGGPSKCPSTHPVPLPAITEHILWTVRPGANLSAWRLASDTYSTSLRGGFSAHADWMNGWDASTMTQIVTQCLNKALDCGVGGIGAGAELF